VAPLSAGGSIDHRPDICGILDPQVANMVVVVVLAATSRLNMQVVMMGWVALVAFTQAEPCSLMDEQPPTGPRPEDLSAGKRALSISPVPFGSSAHCYYSVW
jgi:hypothetical protein